MNRGLCSDRVRSKLPLGFDYADFPSHSLLSRHRVHTAEREKAKKWKKSRLKLKKPRRIQIARLKNCTKPTASIATSHLAARRRLLALVHVKNIRAVATIFQAKSRVDADPSAAALDAVLVQEAPDIIAVLATTDPVRIPTNRRFSESSD